MPAKKLLLVLNWWAWVDLFTLSAAKALPIPAEETLAGSELVGLGDLFTPERSERVHYHPSGENSLVLNWWAWVDLFTLSAPKGTTDPSGENLAGSGIGGPG